MLEALTIIEACVLALVLVGIGWGLVAIVVLTLRADKETE